MIYRLNHIGDSASSHKLMAGSSNHTLLGWAWEAEE